MKITRQELQSLLELIGITADEEINCEEFLEILPGYLDRLRVQRPDADGNSALLHHLKICPECLEEFEALVDAINDDVL